MTNGVEEFDYSATVPDSALFVAADEPLLVFPSTTAAERFLEAEDVKSGVYAVAFGPNGEPYRIGRKGRRVLIERTGEPNRPAEFKILLVRYLEGIGHAADKSAALEKLVAQVWKWESDFWQENDPDGDRFAKRMPWWGCLALALGLGTVLYLTFR